MKGFLAFGLCLVVVSGHFVEYEDQWLAWKSFHEKQYKTQTEEDARYAIWRDNLRVSCSFLHLVNKPEKVNTTIIDEGFSLD